MLEMSNIGSISKQRGKEWMKKIIGLCITVLIVVSLMGCTLTKQEQSESSYKEVEEGIQVISTSKGEVEVPINPQRVIVDYFMGDVISLGIKPVGVTYIHPGAFLEGELSDVASINGEDSYGEYSMETIVRLNPDLIITSTESEYEKLSKIAPTVYIDSLSIDFEDRINLIGKLLGKEKEATNLLEDFYNKAEKNKNKLEELGILDKTITLFETVNKEIYVYGDKQGRGGEILYHILGMKAPSIVQDEIIAGEQYRSLSLEVLDQYIGDIVMITGWMSNSLELVENNTVWLNSKAVKEGHVFLYDSGAYIYSDIYSLSRQMDEITEKLIEMYQ